MRKTIGILILLPALVSFGCDGSGMPPMPTAPSSIIVGAINGMPETTTEVMANIDSLSGQELSNISNRISGVELRTIRGWLAARYPWQYYPEQSPVHPVSSLWIPNQYPTYYQTTLQNQQLNENGSGGDVLQYNPNPSTSEHNVWLRTYFSNGNRPFFLLYEHVFGTRFNCNGCIVDMSNTMNRQVFKDDIKFMFENVITRYQNRYITVDGRAVIYLWASSRFGGDFPGLLMEVKEEYPVFFLASDNIGSYPERGSEDYERIKELDGFMAYTLGGGRENYIKTVQSYYRSSFRWTNFLRALQSDTGKRYLFIPTFQFAYDDTKVIGRSAPALYAKNAEEVKYHFRLIREGYNRGIYDNIGPFVIYSELPEGGAVIESQCGPDTQDILGERFVGCGTVRLDMLKDFSRGL
jgi:hypothetical protein